MSELEGRLLWEPSPDFVESSNLSAYMRWLDESGAHRFRDYFTLWLWSVTKLEEFWRSIWDYFHIPHTKEYNDVLTSRRMPGARWFVGSELNYAQIMLEGEHKDDARVAVVHAREGGEPQSMSWGELRAKVASFSTYLRSVGVKKGDRVAGYLPNTPEALIALLSTASIGAVWSGCSPDFGPTSTVDRFSQIQPKILVAVDGYTYGGKLYDRREVVERVRSSIPTIEHTVLLANLGGAEPTRGIRGDVTLFEDALATPGGSTPVYEEVEFNHPLWVLFTSGTTGPPKPVVHSHGGIVLEHIKSLSLHHDIKPEHTFFWFTTTGWMMWNLLVGGLLIGARVVLYDGNPMYPRADTLWGLAESVGITHFGVSAAYINQCIKSGVHPREHGLSRLIQVGSTGSPLSVEGFYWVYREVKPDVWLASVSGGTDVCSAFVGGCPLLPVYAGEIQCRYLGARVESYDDSGNSVVESVGELVVTEPMPSMPIYFWGDVGDKKYTETYFSVYPGVWRHGDWIKITQRGTCIIYGRSDSTIKRHGVRIGTAEIYRAVESLPEVLDSLAVDLEGLGGESKMLLFVVLKPGVELNPQLESKIKEKIRVDTSPRFVPDEVYQIAEIPRTLNGKKLEVPVKRIIMGLPLEKAVNMGSVANPDALKFFLELRQNLKKAH
ncbi:MAG: acetoacetate--CoA ligase [Thermoprotei archaeon]